MKLKHFITMSLICLGKIFIASAQNVKSYDGYNEKIEDYRIPLIDLVNKIQHPEDIINYNQGSSSLETILLPKLVPHFEETLKKHKLQKQLNHENVAEIIRQERTKSGKEFSWTDYYDIVDIYGYLQNMSSTYSKSTKVVVGGRTYEGRQIKGLRINTPQKDSKIKPAIFIESGIHANEWIGPATTTYFINQLLTSDNPDIVTLRNQYDWHIFPCFNPDGYHYSHTTDRKWRKNRSKQANGCYGADPNRNWDYHWSMNHSSSDSCADDYCGSEPFSEIETKTMATYISNVKNLVVYLDFHAYSTTVMIPYSDSTKGENTSNSQDLVNIGKKGIEYTFKVNGTKYGGPATVFEILGYAASGGSMDWVRYALGTPIVFGFELRGDETGWPKELIPVQGEEVTQMILGIIEESRRLGYFK